MESAKLWIRDNCNTQRLQRVFAEQHPVLQKAMSLKTPWTALFIATCVLLVRYVGGKQRRRQRQPKTKTWWKSRRLRSPDPEKPPTDVNQFAEKRMKEATH
ncbi:Uu.00g068640.m01.CDS01 [Anthostomella pinea]|uniref:Uu.00g068640.m01.CDS01 n=1 Tax=Anthostomella pinea TaxID=933095 RepID=A0AAI8YND3_9PEZI|nr:Uu.00g068640.m01.CDS01 [Anthostomella pinea]